MSRQCEYCGKTAMKGHKVSHSNRKSRKLWQPNIAVKKLVIDGVSKKIKICAGCLKTYTKKAA